MYLYFRARGGLRGRAATGTFSWVGGLLAIAPPVLSSFPRLEHAQALASCL